MWPVGVVLKLSLFARSYGVCQICKLPKMNCFAVNFNVRLPTAVAFVPCYAKVARCAFCITGAVLMVLRA